MSRAMKTLYLSLFLTSFLFGYDQVAADFGRVEYENRLGENRVDQERRLVLDNDRYFSFRYLDFKYLIL